MLENGFSYPLLPLHPSNIFAGSTTNTTGTATSSGCICNAGQYEDHNTKRCESVVEGVHEDTQGMSVSNLKLKKGFWRTSNTSFAVLPCLGEHHCAGGADMETRCEDGYEGPLCAVCSKGYAGVGAGPDLVCNMCTGSATQTIMAVGIGMGVAVLLLVAWCCKNKGSGSIEEQALRASENAEKQGGRARGLSESALAKKEAIMAVVGKIQPYSKIFLSYFQVAGGLR